MAEVYCNKYNVNKDEISPEEKNSNAHSVQTLTDQHTWGCPVYILDARLQDQSGSLPKWDPRSCLGIYLGPSNVHAGNDHLELVAFNGVDLKGILSENTWEFPDEYSTTPPSI
eukprot:14478415-Ditylum_brightwellii.AAC.1